MVAPESVLTSPVRGTDVAESSPELPDLSLEGPFDVHQDRPVSGASPRVLDGMRCYYLGDNLLQCLVECVCVCGITRLKCRLSGDAPQLMM